MTIIIYNAIYHLESSFKWNWFFSTGLEVPAYPTITNLGILETPKQSISRDTLPVRPVTTLKVILNGSEDSSPPEGIKT